MRSLRGRLFVATLGAVLGSIVLTLVVGAVLVRRSLERSALTNLGREAALVAVRHESRPLGSAAPRSLRLLLGSQGDRLIIASGPLAGRLPDRRAARRRRHRKAGAREGHVAWGGLPFRGATGR